ncbi:MULTISPECIES: hypothetical protein [unclassified Geomicrobium]|nr:MULTISPECIES: hypothetical protein [unclassified Geomicrobium]
MEKHSPFYEQLGFRSGVCDPEGVYMELTISNEHLNRNGSLHGAYMPRC